MELNVVHEGDPGTDANSFVGLAAHSDPWILCVNFIHNPIPLCLCLTNDEAMGQLVSLLGLCNSNVFLGLEGFLEIFKLLFSCFFLGRNLVVREFKKRNHLLPNCKKGYEGFLNLSSCSLLLNQIQDSNDVDELFLVVTSCVGGHLELSPIGELDLDLCRKPLINVLYKHTFGAPDQGQTLDV